MLERNIRSAAVLLMNSGLFEPRAPLPADAWEIDVVAHLQVHLESDAPFREIKFLSSVKDQRGYRYDDRWTHSVEGAPFFRGLRYPSSRLTKMIARPSLRKRIDKGLKTALKQSGFSH